MTTPDTILAAAHAVAEVVIGGGRLVIVGDGLDAIVANHAAVEFAHPVTAGHPAVAAVAVSAADAARWADARDLVITIGDVDVDAGVRLPGSGGGLAGATVFHHLLWETAHAIVDDRQVGADTDFLAAGSDALDDTLVDSIARKLDESERLRRDAVSAHQAEIARVAAAMRGSTVYTAGNGGSATDASWLAAALGPEGRSRCLTDDVALLTALANDVGYETALRRSIAVHGSADDVFVAFSTSGTSPNILAALAAARDLGMVTVALVGVPTHGREEPASTMFRTTSSSIHRTQEVHAALVDALLDGVDAGR